MIYRNINEGQYNEDHKVKENIKHGYEKGKEFVKRSLNNGRNLAKKVGLTRDKDTSNDSEKYKYESCGIFESVEFFDTQNAPVYYIECNLIEESDSILNLNELSVLKFIKKEDTPEDFRKEALKICQTIQDESGKKGVEGVWGTAFKQSLGIRINNAYKKIENGKIKNCYIIGFPYKSILKANGSKPKFIDNLVMNTGVILNYMDKVLSKLGYKKTSKETGSYTSWCKNGKECLYGIDCVPAEGTVNIYIRCLEDSKENRAILAGGNEFLK